MIEDAMTIWELVDRGDVPALAVLTVLGFFLLWRSNRQTSETNRETVLTVIHENQLEAAKDRAEIRNLAESFKSHIEHDREDMGRMRDEISETRRELLDAINSQ